MRLLVVACHYPKPDEASGDLRFFTLLTLIASGHDVMFCGVDGNGVPLPADQGSRRLHDAGIEVSDRNFAESLKSFRPDTVWFEFYTPARWFGLLVRKTLPSARIVIDSVDVHFNRLFSRARLLNSPNDWSAANETKNQELSAYAMADLVVAVSAEDKAILQRELPSLAVDVIPNIHAIPPYPHHGNRRFGELVFVGGFRHEPNVDAVEYFCSSVLPLISAARPEVRLKIIGSNPPAEITRLSGASIDVVGYVPTTAPHLEAAYISVAPLRYGGGMKGKVGEAMSHGLPVVTTSFGAEGFGLKYGDDALIGDTADEFAAHVVSLLNDTELHKRVSMNGYKFIREHYSVDAVKQMLEDSLQKLPTLPRKGFDAPTRLLHTIQRSYDRHLRWRFSR